MTTRLAGDSTRPLWGNLQPGRFSVGFNVERLRDRSRSLEERPGPDRFDAKGRPIHLSVWYPATPGGTPLTFDDYVLVYTPGIDEAAPATDAERTAIRDRYAARWYAGIPRDRVTPLLRSATAAARDAPAAQGRFPLVLYAPGYNATPLTHTVTLEYLASHGFVVASVPSVGTTFPGMTLDVEGAYAQARDLEFALAAVVDRPYVDPDRVAIVGFSLGASAALTAAAENAGIDAVVSLDGGTGFWNGVHLNDFPSFVTARMRAPLLHINSATDPENDLSLLRRLSFAPRCIVSLRGMDHEDFIPTRLISAVVRGPVPEAARVGYEVATSRLLAFLDAALQARREPACEPASGHDAVATVAAMPAVPAPTESEWAAIIERDGAARARQVFDDVRRRDPHAVPFSAGLANLLGQRLLDAKKYDEALAVFEMAAAAYPESDLIQTDLGDAQRQAGHREAARRAYTRAVQLNPANRSAKQGLRQLSALKP